VTTIQTLSYTLPCKCKCSEAEQLIWFISCLSFTQSLYFAFYRNTLKATKHVINYMRVWKMSILTTARGPALMLTGTTLEASDCIITLRIQLTRDCPPWLRSRIVSSSTACSCSCCWNWSRLLTLTRFLISSSYLRSTGNQRRSFGSWHSEAIF